MHPKHPLSAHSLLRNFLYLDLGMLDGYLAAIEGALTNEEIRTIQRQGGSVSGEAGVTGLKIGGTSGSTETKESQRRLFTDAAKFQRLYLELEADDIPYFETMDEETWGELSRNQVLELGVVVDLPKIHQWANAIDEVSRVADVVKNVTGHNPIDQAAEEAITGLRRLSDLEAARNIRVVMSLSGEHRFKLVADLAPEFLRVPLHRMVTEATVFCKVLRKLSPGEKMELFDPLSSTSSLPMNRHQRRSQAKRGMPSDLRDSVRYPAATVSVLAIYQ